MPIYEYQCQDCGNCFEYLVIGKPDPECTDCQSKNVSRQMSTCGFFSKGAGGETIKSTAADTSCGGCSASSCAGCGH